MMKFLNEVSIKINILINVLLVILFYFLSVAFSEYSSLFLIGCGMVMTIMHISFHAIRYHKIYKLSIEINHILNGHEHYDLNSFSEGELAILQNQIQKMTIRLREQTNSLKKEKQFLMNSIADISHQINTPLTSINIIVSMLSESNLSENKRIQLMMDLTRLLTHMQWLITTLLKISKLDANAVVLRKEKISVHQIINEAASLILVSMDLRNQTFSQNIEKEISFTGDYAWSVQAVQNILKNCMEHTPENGTIKVCASENAIFTEIVIMDDGEGISAEDLPNLFLRFYQGKQSKSQNTGIGLSLSKMIITEQNGTIKASNNPKGGARFTIRFYKGIV